MMSDSASGDIETVPFVTRTSNEVLSSKTTISFLPVGHSSPERTCRCAAAAGVKWNITFRISVFTPRLAFGVGSVAGVDAVGAGATAGCPVFSTLADCEPFEHEIRHRPNANSHFTFLFAIIPPIICDSTTTLEGIWKELYPLAQHAVYFNRCRYLPN